MVFTRKGFCLFSTIRFLVGWGTELFGERLGWCWRVRFCDFMFGEEFQLFGGLVVFGDDDCWPEYNFTIRGNPKGVFIFKRSKRLML